MDAQDVRRIRDSQAFQELERRRNGFCWTLCAAMLGIYLGFIFLVAFGGNFVATQISGPITLAFPLGIGVILSAVVLTGIYVLRANTEFDTLTRQIVGDARPGAAKTPVNAVGVNR